jgi:hypothetical protein
MPRRENGAQRKVRRDAKAVKKKKTAAKAKAKEEARGAGAVEEKSIEEILAELDAETKTKEVKPEETVVPQPIPRLYWYDDLSSASPTLSHPLPSTVWVCGCVGVGARVGH